ncbi:hypothetical protein JCM15548_12152 [Geofilum rubicundum JCM 15548]|uniref:Uncharacterized protein n=2 Tax=Geofilum TaxID=1236988 RepID=A0A0E9LWH5_9BACT|nr:hypothetical protein JCM15548_12152 [Geofilum rubicundum JCM 15548]
MLFMLYLAALSTLSIKALWQSKSFAIKAVWIKLFVGALLVNWVVKLVIGGGYY